MKIQLQDGADATLIAFAGERAAMMAPKAFAPGAPLRFTVSVDGTDKEVQAKSIGSKKEGELFCVKMRTISVRKVDRIWLESQFA